MKRNTKNKMAVQICIKNRFIITWIWFVWLWKFRGHTHSLLCVMASIGTVIWPYNPKRPKAVQFNRAQQQKSRLDKMDSCVFFTWYMTSLINTNEFYHQRHFSVLHTGFQSLVFFYVSFKNMNFWCKAVGEKGEVNPSLIHWSTAQDEAVMTVLSPANIWVSLNFNPAK